MAAMADAPWWTTLSEAELLELRRRCLKYLRTKFGAQIEAELEDVVQKAFVALLRRRESVSPVDDGLFRYLRTVARNAAIDRLKAVRHQCVDAQIRAAQGQADLLTDRVREEPAPSSEEEKERIREFLCALSDLDRLVLWSHVVEGKSVRAIARDLDLNWHRVAGILRATLDRVRRKLT
jgi:RNA polymerase sigma factor (sigma-70 family)